MEINSSSSAYSDKNIVFITGDSLLESEFWNQQPCSDSLQSLIANSCLSVTNLEAPIASNSSVVKYGSRLSSSEGIVDSIQEMGFDAVALSNNHIMDHGKSGLCKTIEYCGSQLLGSFGAGMDEDKGFYPLVRDINGSSVAMVGISEHEGNVASGTDPGAAWSHSPKIYPRLESLVSKYDVVILVAHGGLEYVPIPPSTWRSHLRTLSQTGIDAIVAHHPHTPQGWEIFQGTPIFYSLGNFLMYNSEWPSTTWSYGIKLYINDGVDKVQIVLLEAKDGRVSRMDEATEQNYRKYLEHSSKIISDEDAYSAYWQEIAHRLCYANRYRYQYHHRFKEYGVGHLLSFLFDPIRELDRATKGTIGKKSSQQKGLALRDYTLSESHRDAIQTGIGIQTGAVDDLRSREVSEEIDTLFQYSDGRPDRSYTQRQTDRIREIYNRMIQ